MLVIFKVLVVKLNENIVAPDIEKQIELGEEFLVLKLKSSK